MKELCSLSSLEFLKSWTKICPMYITNFTVSKKMGPTIIVAVMVQHTLTLMSCSGSSYINIGLSTVSVFMWPFK